MRYAAYLKTKLFLQIALYLCLCFFGAKYCFASKPIIKTHEPFFTETIAFFDKEHSKRYLDEFEDQTVLLVFWASWCGDCSDSMISLDVLAKDFRKLPFKIIALSEDHLGIEVIEKFYQDHELRHLEKFYDYQNAVFKSMGITGIPTAFLIIPDNKVKVEFKGRIKWHDPNIRELILAEIQGNPTTPKNSYKKPEMNYNLPQINSKNKMNSKKEQPELKDKESKDNLTEEGISKEETTKEEPAEEGITKEESTEERAPETGTTETGTTENGASEEVQ